MNVDVVQGVAAVDPWRLRRRLRDDNLLRVEFAGMYGEGVSAYIPKIVGVSQDFHKDDVVPGVPFLPEGFPE